MVFIIAVPLCGCATATRLTIKPEERESHFIVHHAQPISKAFSQVELALGEAVENFSSAITLKQHATHTFLLHPEVAYRVGGPLGVAMRAPYVLKVVVTNGAVTLDFTLERAVGEGTWPPETEMPGIKQYFAAIAGKVAISVDGTLE